MSYAGPTNTYRAVPLPTPMSPFGVHPARICFGIVVRIMVTILLALQSHRKAGLTAGSLR